MPNGFDTVQNCAANANAIRNAQYDFVARYLSIDLYDDPPHPKVIGRDEANAIWNAGLKLVLVYEDAPSSCDYFSALRGYIDGLRAATQAGDLGARNGGLYFTVDYDAPAADIDGCITSYFHGVASGVAAAGNGNRRYGIGVYGSGSTCRAMQQAGLVQYTWLANSAGWSGYDPSRPWSIVQQAQTTISLDCGTMHVDPDTASANFGAFVPPAAG
ncbi:hypothetical protein WS67_14725 [Burkholderia singularis]|uniref:Rv2525c-like glycoside hydrolase-like domain-containing protein n=1 Tax=Burkholderia singularis TaxID=1503053 RepID=A0A103E2F7_9BURK|nr:MULTISPECIES: glycoside hydrolase domain-containing protein [Burkholderia]AOK28087.1 hypothetical protein AQ611_00235 [Burkholderia sp. Bp7605]KVE26836.1 hypothetical protein WS67_14725 [Burkholderia singularis]SMG01040.1 unknown [Burkholderia singularis]